MNRCKKLAFYLSSVVGLFIFFEIISFTVLLLTGNVHWNYTEQLKRTSELIFQGHPESETLSEIYGNIFSKKVPHPYFAFHYGEGADLSGYELDIHGFFGEVKLPFFKKPNDFVVAILGGSVARQLSEYILGNKDILKRFKNHIKKNFPTSKNKEVKVVNLAVSGGKQPQQFLIASYFLKYLDLTINVEGNNEAISPPLGYPLEFPDGGQYMYIGGISLESRQIHQERENIIILRRLSEVSRLERDIPILKFSHSYFLIHRLLQGLLGRNILKNLHQIKKKDVEETYFSHLYKDRTKSQVEIWENFSLQQYRLLKAYNVKSFFFLQPIPIILNAKIYSQEEKDKYIKDNPEKRRFYKIIASRFRELNQEDKPFYDLRYVFKDVAKTVYIDDCCHLNNLGLEFLFEELLNKISPSNNHSSKIKPFSP
ncbi:MAG: hypothetical protein OXB88_03855 [Bacteriovoracales bacterium]|nr:hypothetical protein [Bacteriovoracales bacterium]